MTETTDPQKFINGYISFLELAAKDGSIGPGLPAMALDTGNQLSVFCLMVGPAEAFKYAVKYIREKKPVEMAFGLDRFCKENQDVDPKYDSVFTLYHMSTDKKWSLGVFPYNKQGEFGPVDWHNVFWEKISASPLTELSKLSKEVYDAG
jgi:hypothetical protein